MDTRISMIFIWIVWQHLQQCSTFHELEYDLKAKNLSLTVRNNEALLTWNCDVPMENINILYEIHLKQEIWDFRTEERECGKEVVLTLPNDFTPPVCFQVVPVLNENIYLNASEICVNPERNELAENVQCFIYNTSSMKCTWNFSENVPNEAEYTLSLKQDVTINCHQYMNDLEKRTGSCSFHDLTIDYFKDVTVTLHTNISESHVLKENFLPAEKEIFNPPTNLTIIYSEEKFNLSWKIPLTHYYVSESCFQYQMEKNKELISFVSNPTLFSNLENKYVIRIRAKGEDSCRMNTNWGQWSEEISCVAPHEPPNKAEFIILITILGLAGFIMMLTIIISIYYKRIIKLLFPRIPQPKNYFDEIQDFKTNQIQKIM